MKPLSFIFHQLDQWSKEYLIEFVEREREAGCVTVLSSSSSRVCNYLVEFVKQDFLGDEDDEESSRTLFETEFVTILRHQLKPSLCRILIEEYIYVVYICMKSCGNVRI